QLHEQLGDVDLDRADLVAGAAQGRGVRKRLVDLARGAAQLRVEHRTDRPRVDRAVGVAAGALVDRADVEAGRAADAPQRLAPDAVAEDVRATVVEQDDVHLLRAVPVVGARPRRGVGVHPLTGARA